MQPLPQDLMKAYVQSQHFTSSAEIILHPKTAMRLAARFHQVDCVALVSYINANE